MSAQVPDSAWLENINKALADQGVEPCGRVTEALGAWLPEPCDVFTLLLHPANTVIREWFAKNTKVGSLQAEPFRLGAFFWDYSFWSLKIPLTYGSIEITDDFVFSRFEDIPEYQKSLLQQDKPGSEALFKHFRDELRLFHHMENVTKAKDTADENSLHGVELLEAANLHFEAASYLLGKPTPNPRVVEVLRFVVEIALKALLASHYKLTPIAVKKDFGGNGGHDLDCLYASVLSAGYNMGFERSALKVFPNVGSRYLAEQFNSLNTWNAYQLALQAALLAAERIEESLIAH